MASDDLYAMFCTRCGEHEYSGKCMHYVGLHTEMTLAEAERIRARYALGKRFNPEHDTTSYRD